MLFIFLMCMLTDRQMLVICFWRVIIQNDTCHEDRNVSILLWTFILYIYIYSKYNIFGSKFRLYKQIHMNVCVF